MFVQNAVIRLDRLAIDLTLNPTFDTFIIGDMLTEDASLSSSRAFFHHFGTMTCTPGIGNFSVKMPKIGKFLVLLAVLSNHKIHHIFI